MHESHAPPHPPAPVAEEMSLDDLLLATGRRDVDAFARLYDAMAPRIYGTVLRVVRDPHQSEEVVQEVLLQVWSGAERFDPARGTARAWITTLAHRRAVDRVRHSEAERARDARSSREPDPAPYDQTATAAHASIEAKAVHSAFDVLSAVQRESIELAYFGGYTYREVAALMQSPIGTTKARIRDGLRLLRDVLIAPQAA